MSTTTSFTTLDAEELDAVSGGKSSSDTRTLQALNGVTSAAKALIPGGAGPATLTPASPSASTPTKGAGGTATKLIRLPELGKIGG